MGDEIVELTRDPMKRGLLQFHVLYLYHVDPPVQVKGNVVKLTPRDTLPPGVIEYGLLTDVEIGGKDALEAIDDGSGAFLPNRIDQHEGEALGSVLARAQAGYAKGWIWLARQRARYEHAGDTYDAT